MKIAHISQRQWNRASTPLSPSSADRNPPTKKTIATLEGKSDYGLRRRCVDDALSGVEGRFFSTPPTTAH